MRRVLLIAMLFIFLITACAPASPTERPAAMIEQPAATPIPRTRIPARPSATPTQMPVGPAEETVIEQLAANLGLQESDISVLRSDEIEFKDACLGMVMEGIQCAQVITPGRSIVLEAAGVQYEYHTSRDGKRVQPASLALVWKRSGGIAGFCDTLTVFLSGEVFASQCKPQAKGKFGTFADLLSAQERTQFNGWITKFAGTNLDASDPKGVADGMQVTLRLLGNGTKSPTKAEQQALFEFAQSLYQKLAQ